jgi:uncharacterized protein (DUF58 family)
MHLQDRLKQLGNSRLLRRNKRYPELVSKSVQNKLRSLARSATPVSLDVNLEVHQQMLGERLSPFARSGYEFAETRLYQVGDNVRFINWRRYANTGELYINTFHEERRPQCWIVMDRRANMRFGTRIRLKVAQAAIYALYHLFKAQQHQFDIGGVVLDHEITWYDTRSASGNLQPLIKHINAPCPPLADKANDHLNQSLRLLSTRLSPGCLIIFMSDFVDLKATDLNFLSALASKHMLAAVHVIDPIEARLPTNGQYNINHAIDQTIMPLNCNDTHLQAKLNQQLWDRLAQIEQILKQAHVHYKQGYGDEGFEDLNL